MKREIKSEAELLNALCKGVGVESKFGEKFNKSDILYLLDNFPLIGFRYSDPVKVVELWFYPTDLEIQTYHTERHKHDTHKQTQIHQNGKIIWTETIEL